MDVTLRIKNRLDQHRVFGLITFSLSLPNVELTDQIRVSIGQVARDFSKAELVDRENSSGAYMQFSVVTHLLPNGPATLAISRLTSEGIVQANGERCSYEMVVDNSGALAAKVRLSLRRANTPLFLGAVIDSAMWPYGLHEVSPWFEAAQPSLDVALSLEPAPDLEGALAHMHRWGFCLLPNLFPSELCDELNAAVDQQIAAGNIDYEWGSSKRLLDIHRLPAGRRVWTDGNVITLLRRWFDDEPVACQTLYYVFGSQQGAHQDTIHLTPYPGGYMCGVWVALQDIELESGELFVYPGSHMTPKVRARELGLQKVRDDYSSYAAFDDEIKRLLRLGGFDMAAYRPRKGQILVWHENLIHGGLPRRNLTVPRRSIVSHYFARGSIAYYDARGEAASLEEVG